MAGFRIAAVGGSIRTGSSASQSEGHIAGEGFGQVFVLQCFQRFVVVLGFAGCFGLVLMSWLIFLPCSAISAR